jgi:lipopolysaccharide/colanic/teichoic acid biosynthesis glycosyltransferase
VLNEVLGALITDWTERLPGVRTRDPLLLTAGQFNREVARERVRAIRRSFPFCVITIDLVGIEHRRRRAKMLVRLLHRNLRITDHKAILGPGKYGVLLVDTPEMGGRSALDRIVRLADQHSLKISVSLRVHDPEGFDPDDDAPADGQRRRDDEPSERWLRVDGDVQVSAEDPLVPRPLLRMATKRAVDIVGATVGLLVTGPVILASMVAVKRHDSGPALYKQTREGFRGRPFTIYKLRTMVVDAEKLQAELRDHSHRDGPAFKIAHDPRVTPIGRFLRRSCIDELPQLINILKGDMSLVGPRPLPWHESRACENWQRRRLDVRPGLTCDWQIEKSKIESFDDWMRLDLRYIDEIGLFRDLRLIARTFAVPMSGRGGD